jgi:hypothetical protein
VQWHLAPIPDEANRCEYCNCALTSENKTRDHVLPKSAGGKRVGNLVWACKTCNQLKANLVFANVNDAKAYMKGLLEIRSQLRNLRRKYVRGKRTSLEKTIGKLRRLDTDSDE